MTDVKESGTSTGKSASENSYVINPAVAVIRCSDNEIFVRHGSRSSASHRIEDSKNRKRLADFVSAFARVSTVAEAAALTNTAIEDAEEFIEHLVDGRALLTEADVDFGYVLAGLGMPRRPEIANVAVVGDGRLSQALQRQLADALNRAVTAVVVADADDLLRVFEEHDFVVVASDTVNPGLGYDADEAATESGTPWQWVYLDGGEAMIGPTFLPGVTAGYYDLDTMDEAGRTMRMDHQFLKTARPDVPSTAEPPLLVAELAAGYAAIAVVQHLTGKGSYLENHVLRLDLERLHVIKERVLRLPRNPVDIASRDDLRHPFL